jgi:hypothetical protein
LKKAFEHSDWLAQQYSNSEAIVTAQNALTSNYCFSPKKWLNILKVDLRKFTKTISRLRLGDYKPFKFKTYLYNHGNYKLIRSTNNYKDTKQELQQIK